MPALMLLTLVENAIKHGLTPLPDGGSISIRAARHEDRLEVSVSDTGGGLIEASGAGTGLANIRARLSAQFGDRAHLALRETRPHGIDATIVLPYIEQPRDSASSAPQAA
jgi:LytS/YehU family sensor histidine kinase